MLVTSAHHKAVVELLREQIADLKAQLVTERREKEWYRSTFYLNHGFKFVVDDVPKPDARPTVVPEFSEIEQRKKFRLEKGEWTNADRDSFNQLWGDEYAKSGKPPDEIEYWYAQEFGNNPPSIAWRA